MDLAEKYKSIVRLVKSTDARIVAHQVAEDLFPGAEYDSMRLRLKAVARFNPTVNELFFAREVVLLEEFSTIVAFEHAGEVTGLFERHPDRHRNVCLVNCGGKPNIRGFQEILNRFNIAYRVVYHADRGNAASEAESGRINARAEHNAAAMVFAVEPQDLETLLGYQAPSKDKSFIAYQRVGELHDRDSLPTAFIEALNMVYFGSAEEPAAQ